MYILVLKQTFSKKSALYKFALYFTLYFLLASFILNYNIFISFYSTSLSLFQKIQVTPHLFFAGFFSLTPLMTILHFGVALLFALNILLATQKISSLKNPSVKFGIGAGVISLTTAGCASCGLSLLTIFGLGSALTLLPFKGVEILLATLLILISTTTYNLHALSKSCKLDKK